MLFHVSEEPGIVGAQLARNLLVTAQTMTDLLKRLEREGSIERRPDPNNRRADRWYISEDGLARLRAARSAGGPVMTQMLSLLSHAEVTELRGYLERCVEGLERETGREARPAAAVVALERGERSIRGAPRQATARTNQQPSWRMVPPPSSASRVSPAKNRL